MTPPKRHVAVVGAGFAGLAAAWRLGRSGLRVTLLDAGAEAGGRALAPWAPRLLTTDHRLAALAGEAGAAGELLPLRPWVSAQVADGRIEPIGGWRRAPGVRALEALRLVRLGRLLRRYGPQLDPSAPERAAALDDRSLYDFGRLYFGTGVVERWIEPLLADAAPLDERDASRVAFLVPERARQGATAAAPRKSLAPLAAALAARLALRGGAAVRRVEPAAGHLCVALADESLEADAVVVATPAAAALEICAPLLTTAEREHLASTRYDAALVWRVAAEPARLGARARTRVRVPRCEALPFSSLALLPDSAEIVATVREPWSRHWIDAPDDALQKDLGAALERLLPGAARPERASRIARIPAAWPRFDVGRYRAIARFRRVGADRRAAGRRLYFAGDHLVAPTVEAAITSGERAATALLGDVG
ncbi:MAG: FAD-dependent oxidoreductase [Myxococcota bacterium]|nr:FAD-dependent oxidoreductase [Myxococcota bacterium]